ncbi:MAG: SUMF1/EgtB/PvdO family nonheme iron enzyme [Deltaproteobacteria bacterium]|nr:SUMF1/EgtB/PvdO family nonheme iron enzyme [Deltaproteobacteria bacterium]
MFYHKTHTAILCLFLSTLVYGCSSPPEGMVKIPAGEFIMGSDEVDKDAKAVQYGSKKPWYANERPKKTVYLDDFYIDRTEVTNRAYKEFILDTGTAAPKHWPGGTYPDNLTDHPVVLISWFDAKAYCEWKDARLPSEAEWEKAARGTDGRRFPWGEEFDLNKVNTIGRFSGTTTVGMLPDGASPYGALDMAGNAQEWTSDSYKAYPGSVYTDEDYGERFKTVRGGGWGGMGHYALNVYVRTSYRNFAPPGAGYDDVVFRCAW